jgi:pimeloyl-ACP methyl ester carboxylesterase
MDVVLVPGLWLDAASWDAVTPALTKAGHRPHAVEPAGTTLRERIDGVVAAIDAAEGPVALVGHSAGCGIAYGALDARPGQVAHAVLVAGFPTADGDPIVDGFTPIDGVVPLPDWADFDEADLRGLDDAARAAFRDRAIAVPEHVVTDRQHLHDERRYAVPVTAVATEYTTADLQGLIERGWATVREFPKLQRLRYVDLPTGHWPQFSRPDDLAQVIVDAIG